MPVNDSYTVTECIDETEEQTRRTIRKVKEERVYSYDEAIELAGNGAYNKWLLAALSLTSFSVGMDGFGFAVVVTGASCDLNLTMQQSSVLLSVTYMGPIIMAYPWGYIADTRGRRKSLLISLWSSFFFSTLSAFSPDWITLAVLKLISSSLFSCAQSTTYTLVGESCPKQIRDFYILVINSALCFSIVVYVGLAYLISNLTFSYDLGTINFVPWRLLALVLAASLLFAAISLHFFFESPKFLLNAEKHEEAIDILAKIWKINGGKTEFPVKNVILNEEGNDIPKGISVLRSLWEQIIPLFKLPLLWRSVQLYFLAAAVFSVNNGYFSWFPFVAEIYILGVSSKYDEHVGLCSVIETSYKNKTESGGCLSGMSINVFWVSLVLGIVFSTLLVVVAKFAHKKRMLLISILTICGVFGLGAVFIPDSITSFVMLFGVLLNEVVIGIIMSYYVDFYPTSCRAMATCIGTLVARGSGMAGVYLMGGYITTHCLEIFYGSCAFMFGGALIGILLPSDKKETNNIK